MQRIARSSAQRFASFLMERVARAAARASNPTASTAGDRVTSCAASEAARIGCVGRIWIWDMGEAMLLRPAGGPVNESRGTAPDPSLCSPAVRLRAVLVAVPLFTVGVAACDHSTAPPSCPDPTSTATVSDAGLRVRPILRRGEHRRDDLGGEPRRRLAHVHREGHGRERDGRIRSDPAREPERRGGRHLHGGLPVPPADGRRPDR